MQLYGKPFLIVPDTDKKLLQRLPGFYFNMMSQFKKIIKTCELLCKKR